MLCHREARAQALIENHRSSPTAITRCEWWSPYAQAYPYSHCVLVMPACHYHHVSSAHLVWVCVWVYTSQYVCVFIRVTLNYVRACALLLCSDSSWRLTTSLLTFLVMLGFFATAAHWLFTLTLSAPCNSPGLHFLPYSEMESVWMSQRHRCQYGSWFF